MTVTHNKTDCGEAQEQEAPLQQSMRWALCCIPQLGCFLVLEKPLLVCFCALMWILFGVFSIFCIYIIW